MNRIVLDVPSKTALVYKPERECMKCSGHYFIEQDSNLILCLSCEMGGRETLNMAGWKLVKTPYSVVAARL